jgi:hypothetical protein
MNVFWGTENAQLMVAVLCVWGEENESSIQCGVVSSTEAQVTALPPLVVLMTPSSMGAVV